MMLLSENFKSDANFEQLEPKNFAKVSHVPKRHP